MIIQCKSCSRKFVVRDSDISQTGRMVRCGYCSTTWLQKPESTEIIKSAKKINKIKTPIEIDDSPSVDSIKASDGKTYKFLGSQWAELLPSGKTGLFARKKIGKELDQITGRKIKKSPRKKRKRIEEVDPSESIKTSKQLPEIYKPKEGVGFFGFIFLLIIIAFSIIGILKTFEVDLVNSFPEMESVYLILDEQLEYVSETVKNLTVIISDLFDKY
tara:strand:- start:3301 stop:3948 length:648 start_codon:yes stop_codon:yes gene_type:complete